MKGYGVSAIGSPVGNYWQELLFQEFKMLQDVAMNESQKDAGHQICTQQNLCKEEMLDEEAELVSLGKGSLSSNLKSIYSEFSQLCLKNKKQEKFLKSSVELED